MLSELQPQPESAAPGGLEDLSNPDDFDDDRAFQIVNNAGLVPRGTLDEFGAAQLFSDLESSLAEITTALQDGHYDSDPYAASLIRRRLEALQTEYRHPKSDGRLDLAVTSTLLASLIATVEPFHRSEPGGDIATVIVESIGDDPAQTGTPDRILEATSRFEAKVALTASRLQWWPSFDRSSSVVTLGTGIGTTVSQVLGMTGLAAALVSIGLIIVAYTWQLPNRASDDADNRGSAN